MTFSSLSPSADPVIGNLEILQKWLEEVAKNTAQTRDAVEGRASASGGGQAAAQSREDSRFDRFAKRIESAVTSATGQRLGQAQALANRGFSGTVEGARLDYAMWQLGLQFAAVMKPIISGFTYAAVEVERRMRSLSGAQQNGLMGGLIGAGLGLRFGGLPGAIAGFGLGSAYMGSDLSTEARLATAGGAAWAGFRGGGPWGAAAAAGTAAVGTSSDYRRLRESGRNMATAGVMSAGLWGMENLGLADSKELDTARRRWDRGARPPGAPPKPGEPPRRDVTPFSADPLAAGGTAELIQKAIIRATAGADYEDAGPFKPLIDIGLKIIDLLLVISSGGTYTAPPPRPAAETRR